MAAQLKKRFNEQFRIPDRGYYAVALDGRKRQVDACASNMGHCLVYGLVDEDKAPLVAERPMSPEMFSGWGVRTLASDMGAYNPASYHNGSVWPHDNALIASGLLRYGSSPRHSGSRRRCWRRPISPMAGCRNCSAASAGTRSPSLYPIRRHVPLRPGLPPHPSDW